VAHACKGHYVSVREANHYDIPGLVEIGARFHARGLVPVPFCRQSVAFTLGNLIDNEDSVVLIDGDAVAGALLHPAWFNHDHLTGQELFWWAENGNGRQLFAALEKWARDRGADSFAMIALENLRPDAVGALYKRKGYVPTEHSFLKVL
jgi:GNAT superfamily N-acetyltransferase